MLRHVAVLTSLAFVVGAFTSHAAARNTSVEVRVWVPVTADATESRWQACRRVFQYDVFRVRRGSDGRVWCWVDFGRAYGHDAVHKHIILE